MYLIYGVLFETDDNDEPTEDKKQEALALCRDKAKIDRCKDAVEGELDEDSHEMHVFDLTDEKQREKACETVSLWEVYGIEW